jgi:ketosteroid isomerase-like protein
VSIANFAAYAAAFEKAFESDDWSVVEPFFAEDAVYEVSAEPPFGGRFEGRKAVLAYFKEILDRLDRRFDSREIEMLEGPRENGNEVWIKGAAIYRAKGVPELRLVLEETVRFDGKRITYLTDQYEPAMEREFMDYVKTHGQKLGIPLD